MKPARLLAALTALTLVACGRTPPAPSSVLLITLDTTRADALSCYAPRPGGTPVLDRLAAEGVLYERAFTSAPITLTAHASILTGLYPLRHGVRDNGIASLSPSAHTLAEAAREAGVQTAAFVGALVLDHAFGLDQGFEVYEGPPEVRSTEGHPGERPASEVIDSALSWLARRDRARPFFLWIHLYDAHHPYTPRHSELPIGSGDLERYLAEVSEVDSELGRLLDRLRDEEALERTLVCVTADHGEAFGEHQELTHGPFCWNTTLHVPLILRHPDGREAGRRAHELVSLVDVAPTLAEALGVELPDVDGHSLLRGAPARSPGLYFESYTGYLALGWSPLSGWLDEDGKYLHSSRPLFFDLAQDPGEEHDLCEQRGAALEPYRRAIAELAARPALQSEGTIEEALREDIQGLGYAAVDSGPQAFPHPLAPSDRPAPQDRAGAWRRALAAQQRFNAGHVEEAAEQYGALLDEEPTNPFLRGQLGLCLMRLRRFERALEVLLPLVDAPLVSSTSFYRIGVCQERLGQLEQARASLEQALQRAPGEERFQRKLEEVRQALEERGR